MSNKISLCMIVKDEEKYLPQCLNSIKDIVDEMIIVDTGSSDKTVAIANNFGAKVYFFEWNNNFSEARNVSLKYATKDWVLIMDGDDRFSNQDIEKFRELLKNNPREDAIYLFETLSYCGSSIDDNNISVNLNPRLFKNNYGFHYEGEVHNQLVNSEHRIVDVQCPIKIYHYGYLQSVMNSKNKKNRNVPILEEQLRKNPENKYANFNLGTEYFSLDNYSKALEYYNKAYENFDPNSGFGFILIAKLVITNYLVGQYDRAIQFADEGLKYYPRATDLYYLKSVIYNQCNKPILEIKALDECIKLGEPPLELKYLYGTESFKANYALANVYFKLKDYDAAYNYYVETIRAKHDDVTSVYNIGHILKEKNIPLGEFKSTLESFFSDYPKAYQVIADIFFAEGYFDVSLEYIKKCEEAGIFSENLMMVKARAFVRIGYFEECMEMNSIQENSPLYFNFSMYKIMSGLFINKIDYAITILANFKEKTLSEYENKMVKLYEQLVKLYEKDEINILSEDENEKEYTPIIFEILEILLINKQFEQFEKALNLLNIISDKSVLLQLGKLYHKYGYIEMAKKEILRSIKVFEVFDAEGLNILCV